MDFPSLCLLTLLLVTIVTKGTDPARNFWAQKHPSPPTISRFVPARRAQSDNTTRGRNIRYEIQTEHDDYLGHQETCRARGGKLAEPSSVVGAGKRLVDNLRDFAYRFVVG